MIQTRNIFFNICFALNCLLIFLSLFDSSLQLPEWLQVGGRLHPLILHFPIALIVVMIFVEWNLRLLNDRHVADLFLLLVSALCVLAALAGLFLAQEDGYEAVQLLWHKWGGVSLSIIIISWYSFRKVIRSSRFYLSIASIVVLIALVITGHRGADLTHGEGFVFEPLKKDDDKLPIAFEDAVVYTHMVRPILDEKCSGCHNSKKSKGELSLDTEAMLLKGGKTGKLWDTTHHDLGLMFQRIQLPMDSKKHMPPKNKPQLTDEEVFILKQWVRTGADFVRRVSDLPESDTLKNIAKLKFSNDQNMAFDFDAADEKIIATLNNEYRRVVPVAQGSPALKVDFFSASKFDGQQLNDLLKIKDQIVYLNLNKMPVKDESMDIVSQFRNLRRLNLSFTDITGASLTKLAALKDLRHLSLSGTNVTVEHLEKLRPAAGLNRMELWNTPATLNNSKRIASMFPNVKIETGFTGDTLILQLNDPVIVNEQQVFQRQTNVQLKHYINGVEMRYTVDGTEPDSVNSPVYQRPVLIKDGVQFKAKAFKRGWIGSNVVARSFYRTGLKPDSIALKKPADPQYRSDGARTLIDLDLGDLNYRSGKWLGYRNDPMEAVIYFNKPVDISEVTVNMLIDVPGYILPPSEIALYADVNKTPLRTLNPPVPIKDTSGYLHSYKLSFDKRSLQRLTVVVKPLPRIPSWHRGKGEKGWIFIDEILLN